MREQFSDIELLTALQQKRGSACFQVFDLYAKQLQFFVDGMISDTPAAQDIVTESFVKVFERVEDFSSLAKLKSFLFTTTHNAALNYIKSRKRQQQRLVEYSRYSSIDQGEENLLRSEALQTIMNEIDALPTQVREVVRLSLIKGKKLEEIAEEMNIAYKTVQNHKTKGYKILRERLIIKGLYELALLITIFRP